MVIQATLAERGKRYGEYSDVARTSQMIKGAFRMGGSYKRLWPDQVESLDMIANKLARIVQGDPQYADSWHDIAGYATLIADRLAKNTSMASRQPVPGEYGPEQKA